METNLSKINTKHLYIGDGLSPSSSIELLRLVFKSGGASAYLPKDIVSFLNLNKESKSLVAFLDCESEHNYLIITSDKSLAELLKPLILERRLKAERLRQQLSAELQAQRQSQEAEQDAVEVGEVIR